MKLVDILARELKVWPEGYSHIVQDHDGECWPSTGHIESSRIVYGKEWSTYTDGEVAFYLEIASDFGSAKVTRAEWQAAIDALNAPKVVEWDGEGEPPVGIECEWHPNVHGWVKVKILGRDGSDTWYRASGEEHSQTCRNMAFFRPIRTAEQVAAEEREAEDNEVMSRYISLSDCEKGMLGRSPERVIIGLMRVMGYRKEPKPCGS